MNDWDPAELSALLDGELNSYRTKELEALIASDSSVRAQFERLQLADRKLRAIVEDAAFRPAVRGPRALPVPRLARAWLALGFAVFLLAWTAGKLAPTMTAALVINAGSLVLLLACLAPFALREARSDETSVYPITGGSN